MFKKILLAGLIGGLVMFIWSSITHMLLPTGDAGISQIKNEEPVLTSLKQNIPESGLYFFPGMQDGMTQDQWAEKIKQGPSGIMVVNPNGTDPMNPGQLLVELLSDIIAVLICAFLVSKVPGLSFASKVMFVTLMGFLPFIVVDVSYWSWYGFPTSYTFAQLIDQVVGFFLAGLVIAWLFKSRKSEIQTV